MSYFSEARQLVEKRYRLQEYGKLKQFHKHLLELMDLSVSFHVPELSDVITATKGDQFEGTMFQGDMWVGTKVPYQVMWIDMNHKVDGVKHKSGMLVLNYEDEDNEDVMTLDTVLFIPLPKILTPVPVRIRHIVSEGITTVESMSYKEDLDTKGMYESAIYNFSSLNMFLKLMLCKNIETKNVLPSKARQKKLRRQKLPLYTHKVLVVRMTRAERKANPIGDGTNRIHLCRGHFKTYTDANPLFGKYTGTYWWQPMARGSKENGVVTKDYVVKP